MLDNCLESRPIRVAVLEAAGLRRSSLLSLLQAEGFEAVEEACSDSVDVIVLSEGRSGETQRRLFDSPSTPLIVVTRDGNLEIYDRKVLRHAAAADLTHEIRLLAAAGNQRNPPEGS